MNNLVYNQLMLRQSVGQKLAWNKKNAESVLLMLPISGFESCNATDAPYRMSETQFSNPNILQSMIIKEQIKKNIM